MPPLPGWLQAQIGTGEGQIAPVVLQRARALYYQKLGSGEIRNGCYFAMDATRPSGVGKHGRFYIICEGDRVYRVMSSGHGNGRNLPGVANFANGRDCAKHFSNAEDSLLTAGGSYVTAELKPSFKGYFRENGQYRALIRTFIQFDGMGETANARPRQIGGHPSVIIRAQCRMKAPGNEYADKNGYVPYGTFINYTGGRSNGCTSWSWSDAKQINAMVKDNPTSLYIYPESRDIVAVGRGVPGAYWNAACKRAIGTPKFWPRETLAPAIAQYKKAHPSPPAKPLPICK
ncbi:murein L,D-transpeptidase catalytic domain family protein [Methyloligella sp. 2.7D]|nr:murein L,D-transpeptidase catalytic domain family protein [Methyloligella sp. GL2]